MSYRRAGFTAIEIAIVVALLGAIAAAGYFGYTNFVSKAHKTTASTHLSPSPTPATPSPAPTPDPYAGWNTYQSKTEGLSFRYPPGWKFNNQGASDPADDGGSFTGPNGVEVDWNSSVSGIGGACDKQTDPHIFFYKILQLPMVAGDYMVELGTGSIKSLDIVNTQYDNFLPLKLGDTGECMFYPLFKSKDGTRNMWLQGHVMVRGIEQPLTSAQIAAFEQVMLSVRY